MKFWSLVQRFLEWTQQEDKFVVVLMCDTGVSKSRVALVCFVALRTLVLHCHCPHPRVLVIQAFQAALGA